MLVFMVNNGFSLYELRKLYIDEFFSFHTELIYVLEKRGLVKEGAYSKITNESDTSNLRTQLFKIGKKP